MGGVHKILIIARVVVMKIHTHTHTHPTHANIMHTFRVNNMDIKEPQDAHPLPHPPPTSIGPFYTFRGG